MNIRDWLIDNFTDKHDKLAPCKCCPTRTELSVCRNKALKENWEAIKRLTLPFQPKKDTK